MSKFEELRIAYKDAYKTAETERENNRRACIEFASVLLRGMLEYFGCPYDKAALVYPKSPHSFYGLLYVEEAAHFEENYCALRVRLTLPNITETGSSVLVMLNFLVSRGDGHFNVIVRTGKEKNQKFEVHSHQPNEFESLYEFIFELIRRKFNEKCQEAMRQNKSIPTTFDI